MLHHQVTALVNKIKMDRRLPQELLLTKEGFEEYARRLKEETAIQYGMTLEQWEEAIKQGRTVEKKPTEDEDNTKQG